MIQGLSDAATKLYQLVVDFLVYAPTCLKIAGKDGRLVPLELNTAQRYLHAQIEDQLERRGWVRKLVLKGRQQGISTYTGGRFYWKAAREFGKRFVILTHLQEATDNLFAMVKRYHDNVPAAVRPVTRNDNAKELHFAKLQTRYTVATAGSRGTGRGGTAQYFHGSEVAFWPNAEKHMAGIGQIVPLLPGTEIVLESTANGIGNLFHTMVMKALEGRGDYELVFVPWFWQEEYCRPVPEGTVFDQEELEYQAAFGLSDGQMYWRRMKLEDDFKDDPSLFDQEYPATIEMAFMAGTSKALIRPLRVASAIANRDALDNSLGALILGVDPAEYGDDATALVLRRGHKVLATWRFYGEGNAQIAGRVAKIIVDYREAGDPIDAVCIDVTGVGTGVEAFLTDQRFTNIYRVHNGETAIESEKYRNRGAECWGRMRDWLDDVTRPASLPEDRVLQAELSCREYHYDAGRRLVLQSKEDMRHKGIRSPNTADALALTFAVSVQAARRKPQVETLTARLRRLSAQQRRGGSPGMSA
jgi:hypothetical protein